MTGAFASGQLVTGTGIPINTRIMVSGQSPNTWLLSNPCTSETGETVTGYTDPGADMVLLKAQTQNLSWRDDGTAPAASVGVPMLTTDPALEYAGDLTAIQFIQATSGGVLNASFYKRVG